MRTLQEAEDLLEYAWGIIANAGGGDWTKESKDWQEAAARWRDRYHQQCIRDTRKAGMVEKDVVVDGKSVKLVYRRTDAAHLSEIHGVDIEQEAVRLVKEDMKEDRDSRAGRRVTGSGIGIDADLLPPPPGPSVRLIKEGEQPPWVAHNPPRMAPWPARFRVAWKLFWTGRV